ncbi:MAG TPA: PstS family phosphate ABC transporter substrate-binding protein [Nitrospira sp.]|nr:PstS family phosphate ABC transporter substrate-binding protein [Nitrospira sp.]
MIVLITLYRLTGMKNSVNLHWLLSVSRAGTVLLVALLACPSYGQREGTERSGVSIDPSIETYVAHAQVRGRMTIVGSDATKPLLLKLAMEFRRRQPEATIAVQGLRGSQGSAVDAFVGGLSRMRRGDGDTAGHFGSYDVELLASPRSLTEQEIKGFTSKHGHQPLGFIIAYGAIAVYVNRENAIKSLTLEQIDGIFSSTHKRGKADLRTWGQLGLAGAWANAPIHLYGPPDRSSGTRSFFKEAMLLSGKMKRSLKTEAGLASVIVAVGKDRYGIGYSRIGLGTSAVREVSVSEKTGRTAVAPTVESVMSREYPLSRPFYLYINQHPDKDWDPELHEFLRFVYSRDGQEIVVRTGLFPLSASQVIEHHKMLPATAMRGDPR